VGASLVDDVDRREGDIPETLPQHGDRLVADGRGCTGRDNAIEHGPDRVPDLRPAFPAGPAEHPGVLGRTQNRDVGVVIEDREAGSPPDEDGKVRREAEAQGRAQVVGPGLRRAEVRGRPIEHPHSARHLAAARQEVAPVWLEGRHAAPIRWSEPAAPQSTACQPIAVGQTGRPSPASRGLHNPRTRNPQWLSSHYPASPTDALLPAPRSGGPAPAPANTPPRGRGSAPRGRPPWWRRPLRCPG